MFWLKEWIKGVIIIIILFENAKILVGQMTLNKEKGDGTCLWNVEFVVE